MMVVMIWGWTDGAGGGRLRGGWNLEALAKGREDRNPTLSKPCLTASSCINTASAGPMTIIPENNMEQGILKDSEFQYTLISLRYLPRYLLSISQISKHP